MLSATIWTEGRIPWDTRSDSTEEESEVNTMLKLSLLALVVVSIA